MPNGKGFKKGTRVPRKRGPKPHWFKHFCDKVIQSGETKDFVKKMMAGAPVDNLITQAGEEIDVRAKARDRVTLLFELAAYAYGKPTQAIQATDQEGNTVAPVVVLMPQDKGKEGKVS